jgi:hypothetical protein
MIRFRRHVKAVCASCRVVPWPEIRVQQRIICQKPKRSFHLVTVEAKYPISRTALLKAPTQDKVCMISLYDRVNMVVAKETDQSQAPLLLNRESESGQTTGHRCESLGIQGPGLSSRIQPIVSHDDDRPSISASSQSRLPSGSPSRSVNPMK